MKLITYTANKCRLLYLLALLYIPAIVKAAGPPLEQSGGTPQGLSFRLENPLAFGTLQEFIVAILRVIIVIAVPIVVIFIVLAGFKYVTARGEVGKIQEATRSLTYAIIGGVLIIGAVAIAEIIENLVTAFSA